MNQLRRKTRAESGQLAAALERWRESGNSFPPHPIRRRAHRQQPRRGLAAAVRVSAGSPSTTAKARPTTPGTSVARIHNHEAHEVHEGRQQDVFPLRVLRGLRGCRFAAQERGPAQFGRLRWLRLHLTGTLASRLSPVRAGHRHQHHRRRAHRGFPPRAAGVADCRHARMGAHTTGRCRCQSRPARAGTRPPTDVQPPPAESFKLAVRREAL